MMKCVCPQPGWCELLKKQMGARSHAICQGTADGVSAEACDFYRGQWYAQ